MQVTFTPEPENFIQAELPIGTSNSPTAALNLLVQRRRHDNWAQDFQQKVATAAAELEQGGGVDGETASATLEDWQDLRAAKAAEHDAPTVSLAEAKARLKL